MEQEFPRFSDREMGRRWRAADELLRTHDLDFVVAYGANRSGSAVQWFSGWQVTREALLLMGPGGERVLFVQFYNHVPTARRVVSDCEVRWGGESTAATVAEELSRRNADRIGVIGPLPYKAHSILEAAVGTIVDLDREYTSLRLTKSREELDWLRHGSELTDRAIRALADGVRPGVDERELGAITEGAYLAEGGTNHIHYFAVTSMSEPDRCVPSQWPSTRRVQRGDVLTTEISVNWWGYSGQVLRTMTIDADPTDEYRDLHAVADAAYDAILKISRDGTAVSEIVSVASDTIDDAGYTIYDDLVHGYGGGYLPPILGTRSRANEPTPDMTLSSGMTIVIQPNVITTDGSMGVQTGGLIAVTEGAPEELHQVPRGLWQVGSL